MQDWLSEKLSVRKKFPLTPAIASCIDRFFFSHYCSSFRRGAFARANCSMYVAQVILNAHPDTHNDCFCSPMLNMCGKTCELNVFDETLICGIRR